MLSIQGQPDVRSVNQGRPSLASEQGRSCSESVRIRAAPVFRTLSEPVLPGQGFVVFGGWRDRVLTSDD
jgi:hypothetical protein